MNNDLMFSSKSDNWPTPQYIFDVLNNEFNFILDAAADQYNHKCDMYYDKSKDGLKNDWMTSTFCNPPYGRNIKFWVKKGYEESLKGKCVVMLLPARTDTQWFHNYILNKAEIRFIKGRLKFGDSINAVPFPSMVVIWRQPIPYTDSHIIIKEDLQRAYYRGYMDGIKRSLFKVTKEEAKDGKNSTSDL